MRQWTRSRLTESLAFLGLVVYEGPEHFPLDSLLLVGILKYFLHLVVQFL